MGTLRLAGALAALALLFFVMPHGGLAAPAALPDGTPDAIHKIQHVVIIVQENHSFDSYFGTYPGADGIPGLAGNPGAVPCLPTGAPSGPACVKPYHETRVVNQGGPHRAINATKDINGGAMDGYVTQARRALDTSASSVMGYRNRHDIPNYWTYAKKFVLQDRMFEPDASWSEPAHLALVSGWSATCSAHGDPSSCTPNIDGEIFGATDGGYVDYPWTDLTWLLARNNVSWGYYVKGGYQPDCANNGVYCNPVPQSSTIPSIWNPLPQFDTVIADGQLGNVQPLPRFIEAAKRGKLPAVSWVVPAQDVSEHPPASLSAGQNFVTRLINTVMEGRDWKSTAIFLAWDDWGGFYDHVNPPVVDGLGYGIRVPGLVISAYSRAGYVDHQTLSFDAYLKFIEDDFLGGQRLDPATDGRPDPRVGVREDVPILGNLVDDFDFNQAPRPPVILPLHGH